MGFYIVLGVALYLWLIVSINSILLATERDLLTIMLLLAWPFLAPFILYQDIKAFIEWRRAEKRSLSRPPEFYEGLDPNEPPSEYSEDPPDLKK